MCRIVQDVGILKFYLCLQNYFGTINCGRMSQDVGKLRCLIAQVPLYIEINSIIFFGPINSNFHLEDCYHINKFITVICEFTVYNINSCPSEIDTQITEIWSLYDSKMFTVVVCYRSVIVVVVCL